MLLAGLYIGVIVCLDTVSELGITHILVSSILRLQDAAKDCNLHPHFTQSYVCLKLAAIVAQMLLQSVVNDMPELATRMYKLSMKHYLVDIADMPEANLLPYFQPATMFIKTALSNGGKVFVHCQAGVSRSASVSHAGP